MNERALAGFIKVVELGSFTKAADALFISQSALSQQIRTLENQLHFALFQHNSRQVLLTAAGRNFYPKAKQMLRLYHAAVKEGQSIERNTRPPHRHLLLGCQNVALANFCFDLFALSPEICMTFAPLVQNLPNRIDVFRALASGEVDLSFQHETAEIEARGLRFTPILRLPELCVPFNVPDTLPPRTLALEDALTCRWIFALPSDETLYETQLQRQTPPHAGAVVPSDAITSIQYGLPTLMMMPFIYHRRPNLDFVRMLRWGEGSWFGAVTAAHPDEVVEQYLAEIRELILAKQHQLFGPLH